MFSSNFYEFYLLLRNIISNNKKYLLYLILLTILIFLNYLILFVWFSINSANINDTIFLLLLITISISMI